MALRLGLCEMKHVHVTSVKTRVMYNAFATRRGEVGLESTIRSTKLGTKRGGNRLLVQTRLPDILVLTINNLAIELAIKQVPWFCRSLE